MFSLKYLLPSLLIFSTPAAVATESISELLNNSIYILELVVIAIVAIALIVLTLSIAKSRRRISTMVTDIRAEMTQERAVFAMSVKSIKEKEEQISYMAELLQAHLESDGDNNSVKKKAISNEVIVEILDEITDHQVAGKRGIEKRSTTNTQAVDSRTIAADGSIKQAHFGPDQYLAEVDAYQSGAYQRVQGAVKQADQYLSALLNDIRIEMDLVNAERVKLNNFIAAIKSNIRPKDSQKMNSKDRNIIHKLGHIDARLQSLQKSHLEINKCYTETMVEIKKYAVDLSEDTVDAEVVATV